MLPLDLHVLSLQLAFILSQDQTLHCKSIFSSVKMIFCSVQDAVILLTLFKYLLSSIVSLLSRTSIDGSIFYLYYLYCLSIFQRTNVASAAPAFFAKADAKIRTFSDNFQTFSKFFLFLFSDALILQQNVNHQALSLQQSGCKSRQLINNIQIYLTIFRFFLETFFVTH